LKSATRETSSAGSPRRCRWPRPLASPAVQAGDPIQIGFGMALTGGLAANGKSALVAMHIWQSDVNAKGALLGRPLKLVYFDDQINRSTVPGRFAPAKYVSGKVIDPFGDARE
jgi:ABC-type branched-subunit amino acid transport system substrate-binding protein